MAYQFFKVRVNGAEETREKLNGFLRGHRVLAVRQEWVPAGLEGKVREAIEALIKPAKPSTEGKWVPNDDISPFTNIHGRR